MAAALAYRWDGVRTRLYFQTQDGNYNEESLIGFVRELRRHFPGQQVILLWDGLPSHRSKLMTQFLAEQRHWLEARRLPAYGPELNPVEGLWSNLKPVLPVPGVSAITVRKPAQRPTTNS